jgi:two-component system sensor kinase FixL
MQLALTHASRLTELGQMASTLAHEVNQPLTALTSYVLAGRRLLKAGEAAKADDAFEKAAAQITRTSEVIKRLRHFARHSPYECRMEDIRQIVEETADFAMIGREGRATRLTIECAPDTPVVLIDKVQIQQVLLNLIRNAVEAMQASQRRELVIRIGPLDGMVEVIVMDRGPGLPAAIRAKLFQPFVTTKSAGMGVGLSICRSIIEAHGGRIWVTDHASGGTAFHFTLPMGVASEQNRQPLTARPAGLDAVSTGTVQRLGDHAATAHTGSGLALST